MVTGPLFAQSGLAPLFATQSVLELSIPIDFKAMCRPRETPDCEFAPTVLEFNDEEGAERSIPIEIRIRGGWRALSKNCLVRLVFIRFDEHSSVGTPFEGQSLLALTTHCGRGLSVENMKANPKPVDFEYYLLKEYLGYRLYNEITDKSLNVRLARIDYTSPDKSSRYMRGYAFFAEHFQTLADRFDATLLPRKSFDSNILDTHSADLLALFQFMIGNTDWSVVRQRNTILIQPPDGKQVPVPYDLDMSGLVNAHYAGPPPLLPIENVRERYYLGFCHPDVDWDALFNHFQNRQDVLLALVEDIPMLGRSVRNSTQRFLKKFFVILNSIESRESKIVNACQPWPPTGNDHTTPME
jgi:hypothetical protein